MITLIRISLLTHHLIDTKVVTIYAKYDYIDCKNHHMNMNMNMLVEVKVILYRLSRDPIKWIIRSENFLDGVSII